MQFGTDTLLIPRGGVEFVTCKILGVPDEGDPPVFSVSIDNGKTWHTAEYHEEEKHIVVLVAHPSAKDERPDAITNDTQEFVEFIVKAEDTPEIIIRVPGKLRFERGL